MLPQAASLYLRNESYDTAPIFPKINITFGFGDVSSHLFREQAVNPALSLHKAGQMAK